MTAPSDDDVGPSHWRPPWPRRDRPQRRDRVVHLQVDPLAAHGIEEPGALQVVRHRRLQPRECQADAAGAQVRRQLQEHLGGRRVDVAHRLQVEDDPACGRVRRR